MEDQTKAPTPHAGTYWTSDGRHQARHDWLVERLIPHTGPAPTQHGELLRALAAVYYDVYNGGGCNMDLPHFADHRKTLRRAEAAIGERTGGGDDLRRVLEVLESIGKARPVETCSHCGAELDDDDDDGVDVSTIFVELERVADAVILIVAATEEEWTDRARGLLEMIRDGAGVPTVEHLLGSLGTRAVVPGICTAEGCEELQAVARDRGRQTCRECGVQAAMPCNDLAAMVRR